MANSVAHFEIFASDVERARKFYERVFSWRFEAVGPPGLYLIVTGQESDPGLTHGLLAKRSGPLTAHSTAFVAASAFARSAKASPRSKLRVASCGHKSWLFRKWAR